jgi:hypothetical protein
MVNNKNLLPDFSSLYGARAMDPKAELNNSQALLMPFLLIIVTGVAFGLFLQNGFMRLKIQQLEKKKN